MIYVPLALTFFGILTFVFIVYHSKKTAPIVRVLDIEKFNEKFVAGNKALVNGNVEGLKDGINFFIDSLNFSGEFLSPMQKAIRELYCALSHHDRADTKGPWNRDLSGYGVMSWKSDLYDRDEALRRAWPHINAINQELVSRGYGWKY